jgi:hypothetical protein
MPLRFFASRRVRDPSGPAVVRAVVGRADVPSHATEAVWTLAEHRPVYVVEQTDGAGTSLATILVDRLDAPVVLQLP